jgi:biofilm PGA synthesis N-glycosyltransferase PgaC
MWILIGLFGVATVTIGWTCFAYFICMWAYGLVRTRKAPPAEPGAQPFVSMIVPCYNEAQNIVQKIENTLALDYPRELLEVIFIDGGSTDGTLELLARHVNEPWMRIMRSGRKGKIHQLNEALRTVRGQVLVNSDCDTVLEPDVLLHLVNELTVSSRVGVVGAYSRPSDAMPLDVYYWDAQNKGRLLEARAGSASIAIACCYAFRRELLREFPEDVVADDVYIALIAHANGLLVGASERARVHELRGPSSVSEFLPHKFRKSNAYLREMLRFLYRTPDFGSLQKVIFFSRLAQQVLLPWALAWWVTLALALLTLSRWDVVSLATALLFISFVTTSRIFAMTKLPDAQRSASLFVVAQAYVLTNLLLMATGLTYPFYRQTSSYARVGQDPLPAVRRSTRPPSMASEVMDEAS